MPDADLAFDREFEVSPAIVWDALIDPVLLEGWLARVDVEPRRGGHFNLTWLGESAPPESLGEIVELTDQTSIEVQTDNQGIFAFRLSETTGGARGTGTHLTLRVQIGIEAAFAGRLRDAWAASLDRLGELLRGHPADWSSTAPLSIGSVRRTDSTEHGRTGRPEH